MPHSRIALQSVLRRAHPTNHHQLRIEGTSLGQSEGLDPFGTCIIRQTIQSYQTLYESSIAFGMRRALQAEQRKKDMENKINALKSQTKELEDQVYDLEGKIGDIEVKDKEQQELDKQTHKNNVEAQKRTNQILKEELEKLLQGPQQPGKK